MTELERELSRALEQQERELSRALEQQEKNFTQTLKRLFSEFEKTMNGLSQRYQGILEEQKRTIEKQNSIIEEQMRLLQRYEEAASAEKRRSEPGRLPQKLESLEQQFLELKAYTERSYNELADFLNSLIRKLEEDQGQGPTW